MRALACTVLLSAALFVTGCGTICSRGEAVNQTLQEKAAPCNRDREFAGQFSRTQCESGLDACSDLDLENYTEYLDCIERLPSCVMGQEQAWSEAALRCQAPLGAVSNACRLAID